MNSIGNISWPKCLSQLEKDEKAYLIDVRTPEEWNETGIADLGSKKNNQVKLISWMLIQPFTHINSNFLEELMNNINDKEAQLYFICRSGARSYKAAEAAMQAGYQNCYNLKDGFSNEILRRLP